MPVVTIDQLASPYFDFSEIGEGAATLELPDEVTPEQFAKAEPLVLQVAIEETYIDGIQPLTNKDYRAVKAGKYQGEFRDRRDPNRRFSFTLDADKGSISYRRVDSSADSEE